MLTFLIKLSIMSIQIPSKQSVIPTIKYNYHDRQILMLGIKELKTPLTICPHFFFCQILKMAAHTEDFISLCTRSIFAHQLILILARR